MNKKVTLYSKIARFLSLTLLLVLCIIFFLLNYNQAKSEKESNEQEVENLSTVLINSLKFAMANGATDVKPFVENVKNTPNLELLRILPTNKISAGSEAKFNAKEKEAAASKASVNGSENYNGKDVLTKVTPILSEASCVSCHQSNVGEPLAVVSIYYSLEKLDSDLNRQRIISVILGLLTIGLILGISLRFIHKYVSFPIQKVLETVKELSKGHVQARTGYSSDDEVGEMARTVDEMACSLEGYSKSLDKIADGNISVYSVAADEKDQLSKSFNSIIDSLKRLLVETGKLINAAREGNLAYRGDTSGFKGGYKEIIEGINSVMDTVVVPITESGEVLKLIAHGDLTSRMEGEYKGDYDIVKSNLNLLAESFSSALLEVGDAIKATAGASAEISSSSDQMSIGSQNQSMQTDEVAAAVEEMTKTILSTTQNTTDAAAAAKNAGKAAHEGGKIVEQTIDGMNKIAEVVSLSAATVQTLGKNSDQIGEIIQVIDDIADQTNLLALNAAIEAARAGEQGRGFAVVADEVRKLAERTSKATKEIAATIKHIQNDTGNAVTSMQKGQQEIEKGREYANAAGASLKRIISEAEQVVDIISQVAAASEEQSTTAEEISRSIEKINNVTKENADGISQIARSSDALNNLAENLQNLVGRFKITAEDSGRRLDSHQIGAGTNKRLKS